MVSDVEEFCTKNNIKLLIEYEETNKYAPGKIIYQSRTGRITAGATLKIKVSKEISLPPEIKPDDSSDEENETPTEETNKDENN